MRLLCVSTHNKDTKCNILPRTIRIMSQSHDGVYKRAMNLMSLRCHSNQFGPPSSAASLRYTRTPLIDTSTAPFGPSRRRFFYVDQRKPVPMAPLKVSKSSFAGVIDI